MESLRPRSSPSSAYAPRQPNARRLGARLELAASSSHGGQRSRRRRDSPSGGSSGDVISPALAAALGAHSGVVSAPEAGRSAGQGASLTPCASHTLRAPKPPGPRGHDRAAPPASSRTRARSRATAGQSANDERSPRMHVGHTNTRARSERSFGHERSSCGRSALLVPENLAPEGRGGALKSCLLRGRHGNGPCGLVADAGDAARCS
jgi:hypothetical protein